MQNMPYQCCPFTWQFHALVCVCVLPLQSYQSDSPAPTIQASVFNLEISGEKGFLICGCEAVCTYLSHHSLKDSGNECFL